MLPLLGVWSEYCLLELAGIIKFWNFCGSGGLEKKLDDIVRSSLNTTNYSLIFVHILITQRFDVLQRTINELVTSLANSFIVVRGRATSSQRICWCRVQCTAKYPLSTHQSWDCRTFPTSSSRLLYRL
jgi:hypothetical protein